MIYDVLSDSKVVYVKQTPPIICTNQTDAVKSIVTFDERVEGQRVTLWAPFAI